MEPIQVDKKNIFRKDWMQSHQMKKKNFPYFIEYSIFSVYMRELFPISDHIWNMFAILFYICALFGRKASN